MERDAWISQMRKGLVDFCLLAALHRQDDYAYALIQRLGSEQGLVFSESTVYPALGRLQKEGLLVGYKRPSGDGPPRRYYTLSAEGRDRYVAMAAYWRDLREAVDALIASRGGTDDT